MSSHSGRKITANVVYNTSMPAVGNKPIFVSELRYNTKSATSTGKKPLTQALDPTLIDIETISTGNYLPDTQYHIVDQTAGGVTINSFAVFRRSATRLICLLPSAQPTSSPQQNPVFHRWSWSAHFPDCHFMSLSDPALYSSPDVRAGWFMGPREDIIKVLASHIDAMAAMLSIKRDNIVLYGSSMGGFGALMISAELPGTLAIAEVPQIDMRKYPIRGAIRTLERHVVHSSMEDFYEDHPERVNVLDRFRSAEILPRFKIVTNRADTGFQEQLEFMGALGGVTRIAKTTYDHEIHIVAEEIGHKPLPTLRGVEIVRASLGRVILPPAALPPAQNPPRLSYSELISAAVGKIEKIKFIRDEAETALYDSAKKDLHAAAAANPSADWPYRRLCSLIKLWTNSFNEELLESAKAGMARKESLESFIYYCRGVLYNYAPQEAEKLVDELIKSTSDPEIANVGRIFRALSRYEDEDYKGYCQLIEQFRENKESGFNPYIAIPVSTVVTSTWESLNSSPQDVTLLGTEIGEVPTAMSDTRYIITASCDETYFHKYAEYLVKSFSEICSSEAILYLSVITDNPDNIRTTLTSWGARGVVLNPSGIEAGDNIGPIASLLRFSTVFPLLKALRIPVVVMDLDAVITSSLTSLIDRHAGADICSRILGGGVAPWEKFTGGFAIFNPTAAALDVAGFIASAAESLARSGSKQWWIDQNCFEAGIRMVRQSQGNLLIDNVMSERDEFCVMPVGGGESKIHSLNQALTRVLES